MKQKKIINNITITLVIIGALNWGLIGLFNFNIVAAIGMPVWLQNTIYLSVGTAGGRLLYSTIKKK